MIGETTKNPVTPTKTNEFNNYMKANTWLRLENVRVAKVDWHWNHEAYQDTPRYFVWANFVDHESGIMFPAIA
jgi:hypothetical protein